VYLPHIRLLASGYTLNENIPQTGIPAEYVARVMDHALLSGFPLVRYPTGGDSWVGRFVKYMTPDRVWDAYLTSGLRAAKAAPNWMFDEVMKAAKGEGAGTSSGKKEE